MSAQQMCRLRRSVAIAAVSIAVTASFASADPVRCERTIVKESAKYRATAVKLIGKCKETVITKTGGSPAASCQIPAQSRIAAAAEKMRSKIEGACGGDDRICGTIDDEPLSSIHWNIGSCMGFENQCTGIPITSCLEISQCLECIGNVQVEQALDTLLFDEFEDANFFPSNAAEPEKTRNKCQVAIARSAAKFLTAKEKILDKCWDAKLTSKPDFAASAKCPDADTNPGSGNPPASPGDNKTVEAIKKAEQKKIAAICKACGAGGDADKDGLCDAPPGFGLDDIVETVPFDCPNVQVPPNAVHPSGRNCDAIAVLDLQSYIDCVDCVLEFKADCATAAGVGDGAPLEGIDYPNGCNPSSLPNCSSPPSRYEFTATGPSADLDYGWVGFSHDQALTTNSRLALAVTGCAGSMSGCGVCNLDGPIPNSGGAAFANRRCQGVEGSLTPGENGQNGSWIQCTSNAPCTGLNNACTFFYGPPQPMSVGGIAVCLTSEMDGPLTGTLDADTGAATFAGTWTTRIYVGEGTADPCPRCSGGVCTSGQRSGQTCTVNGSSAVFGDDTSYDCPPLAGSLVSTMPLQLALSTDTQTRTLSAANPSCTAFGFTSSRCLCDTCANAAATPCATNADCPMGLICGGLRCLNDSGAAEGTPCNAEGTNADPVCGSVPAGACSSGTCTTGPHSGSSCMFDYECGGTCARPGEPTKPNSCSNGVCMAGGGTDDGRCQLAPTDGYCNVETYRSCLNDNACRPPGEGGNCGLCAPGMQTCTLKRRECFTDNGTIGGSQSVTGVASTTAPTLGGLACHGRSGSFAANSVYGFPGLVKVRIPGTATIN